MKGLQPNELQGIIEINSKECKGCDACKNFCPTDAIEGKYGSTHKINKERCISCGQCLTNCPFGAIKDKVNSVDDVIEKLKSGKYTVVASVAPAVRVAIGEEFGMEPGTLVTEKMNGALKQAGFKLLDTNLAADNTIMEEGFELVEKIRHYILGEKTEHHLGKLPQFTSCCPAWVKYVEDNYPKIIPHLSSAKSPIMMAGSVAKTYGAKEIWQVEPEKIYTVAIMPCTAKKFEASRPEFASAAEYWKSQGREGHYPDIDAVITTRDLAQLFKKMNIDLNKVQEYDGSGDPLSVYSGAGTIFGNTGGVMEAALRTAHYVITGKELEVLTLEPVRGLKGVKDASVIMKDAKTGKGITLRVAVVHGIKENIAPLIEQVIAGTSPYHFIEVMNCPGGCVNGGGQPINPMGTSWVDQYKALLPW